MKKFFLLLIIIWFATLNLHAQTTFSKGIDIDTTDYHSSNGVSILANETGFFIFTLDFCHNNTCIDVVKTDLDGNMQWVKPIEGYTSFSTSVGSFIKDAHDDSLLHFAAGEAVDNNAYNIGIVTMDTNCENASFILNNPSAAGFNPRTLKYLNDSTYAMKYSIRDSSGIIKIFIKRICTTGEVIDSINIDYEPGGSVVAFDTCSNGYFMLQRIRDFPATAMENAHGIFRRTDMQGISIWEHYLGATSWYDSGFCLVSMPDNKVAVSWASPDTIINGDENAYPFRTYVACLNGENGNLLWRVFFDQPWARELAGLRLARNGDILGVGSDVGVGSGWLFRISPEGELRWSRTYDITSPNFYGGGQLFDLAEAPDGGIAATGYFATYDAQGVLQPDAWLLKVDANGCLTPNCTEMIVDITVGVDPVALPTTTKNDFNLYPIPANNYVFAYYDLPYPNEPAILYLYDLQGKLVLQTNLDPNSHNQTIAIHQLAEGIYIYHVEQNKQLIYSGKLLKQNYR